MRYLAFESDTAQYLVPLGEIDSVAMVTPLCAKSLWAGKLMTHLIVSNKVRTLLSFSTLQAVGTPKLLRGSRVLHLKDSPYSVLVELVTGIISDEQAHKNTELIHAGRVYHKVSLKEIALGQSLQNMGASFIQC